MTFKRLFVRLHWALWAVLFMIVLIQEMWK